MYTIIYTIYDSVEFTSYICKENWSPSPDFGIAGHFIDRVVDVHCILDHSAVLKHLDLLGHTSDGKVVTVAVKLNTETQDAVKDVSHAQKD